MSTYKTTQRRLTHHGREFHFVSCEGQRANPARGHAEVAPTWCLMSAGKRWTVMPEIVGQEEAELDRQLLAWLDENILPQPVELMHVGDPGNARRA
jgi:hypothetical protein